MENQEVERLLQLRNFVIQAHQNLDGKDSPATAMMKQQEAAYIYESVIRSIEDLLSDRVDFS